jgi:hypothetical protein
MRTSDTYTEVLVDQKRDVTAVSAAVGVSRPGAVRPKTLLGASKDDERTFNNSFEYLRMMNIDISINCNL